MWNLETSDLYVLLGQWVPWRVSWLKAGHGSQVGGAICVYHRPRIGFSVIELVVVISMISLLIGPTHPSRPIRP